MGSLAAAVASYLQARSQNGEWLVRIEDIDPQREIAGSSASILQTLEAHGFEFSTPLFQHTRLDAYNSVIDKLLATGEAYYCSCTRQIIEATAHQGRAGLVYPGTCRGRADSRIAAHAVRLRTTNLQMAFADGLQGPQNCELEADIGDFLIRRGDGLVAYQLAVVVDDDLQEVTEVVRGIDLLDATFMQIYLQRVLGYEQPLYRHLPILVDAKGRKLSKQTGAQGVDSRDSVKNIFQALVLLGQFPEESLLHASLADVWAWAMTHWDISRLAGQSQLRSRSEYDNSRESNL